MAHRPVYSGARTRELLCGDTRQAIVALALTALVSAFAYGDSAALPVTAQEGANWIRYSIDGAATEEHEEKDVVMCSKVGDGTEFELRSLGEWTIGITSPSVAFGEHQARLELSPPQGRYRDDDGRTDDRAWGDGTVVLEDGGKDSMGFSVYKGTIALTELSSESGFSFTLEGSFSCQVF